MAILRMMAKDNTGSRFKFCKELLKYLCHTWLDGSIPRAVWNMYKHRGVTTNNHAEVSFFILSRLLKIKLFLKGFNYKMEAKQKLNKHPNPYTLADEFKNELEEAEDKVIAETNMQKKQLFPCRI